MNTKFLKVKSESNEKKEYVIRYVNGQPRCSCPDFIFREKTKGRCKHLEKLFKL